MKKTVNIFFTSLLILAVGLLGEVVGQYNEAPYSAATEVREKADEENRETNCYVDIIKETEQKGQGDGGYKKASFTFVKLPIKAAAICFLPTYSFSATTLEKNLFFNTYNTNLSDALVTLPFYTLYQCPKSYIA